MRERFIFERIYYEAMKSLTPSQRAKALIALVEYVFEDKEPKDKISRITIALMRRSLDGDLKRYESYEKRNNTQYRRWKQAVLERDNYTCTRCGSKENLHVHHIKSFSEFPELRYDVNNGATLCKECHRMEHKNAR